MEISNPIAAQYIVNQGIAAQLNDHGKQLPIVSEQFTTERKKANRKEEESEQQSFSQKKKAQAEYESFQPGYGLDPSLTSPKSTISPLEGDKQEPGITSSYVVPESSFSTTQATGLISSFQEPTANNNTALKYAQRYEETERLNTFSNIANIDVYT